MKTLKKNEQIIYNRKKYWLIGDAYYCGESPAYDEFNNWDYEDDEGVSNGESYLFKMIASAIDETGRPCKICWEFEDIKGAEHDDDWFDYYNPENIVAIYLLLYAV